MGELRRLPVPRDGAWDWQLRAACRGMDTATFYHPENERGPSRARRERQAKAVCAACPVAAQCLDWALAAREPYGVWGGLSVTEREDLLADRADAGAAEQATGSASGAAAAQTA